MVSKKVLPLLLYLLFSCAGTQSQDLNLALQSDFFSFAKVVVPAGEDRWLLGGEIGRFYGFPAFNPYLVMINGEGEVLWERRISNILGTEEGWVSHIFPQKEDTYLVTGQVQGCDYGLPGFIATYDKQGNQLSFTETFGIGDVVMFLPNGDMLTGNRDWGNFGRVDVAEGLIWENQLYFSHQFKLRDLAMINATNVYALGERWLFKLDPEEGEILLDIPLDNGKALLAVEEEAALFLLTENHLEKYDSALNLLQTLPLADEIDFYRLKSINEKIYLLGRNESNETLIQVLDHDLNPIRNFSTFDRYQLVNDFAFQEGELILIGNELAKEHIGSPNLHYTQWPYMLHGSHIFSQSFDSLGQRAANPLDVAVAGIEMSGNPSIEDLGYDCQSIGFSSVSIKIENTGTEVIQSLSLNSRFDRCQGICRSAFTYLYPFENLNLLPGQSVLLPLGNISAPGIPQEREVELCFWVSLPNGKTDNHGANDMFCQSLMINSSRDLNPSFEISFYPNPATDRLQVDFKTPLEDDFRGELFNVLGQRIQSVAIPKGSLGTSLDLSLLDAGTYLLSIGEYTARFVKH